MWGAFAVFSAKNISRLDFRRTRRLNESLTNDFVKLTMLWTTGPWMWSAMRYELLHDKTNKMTVHPAKTQISLGISLVWSESSLSVWRKLGSLATHWVHSEDSWMPRQIWVFVGRTGHFVGFVMQRLICCYVTFQSSVLFKIIQKDFPKLL